MNKFEKILALGLVLMVGLQIFVVAGIALNPRGLGGFEAGDSRGVSEGAISVSAAISTNVLSANSGRIAAYVINDSANTVYCSKGGVAATSSAIRLNASGGTLILDQNDPYRGALNCVALTATSTVVYSEK